MLRRVLRFEPLEARELLAGNTLAAMQAALDASKGETLAWHNSAMPADINGDSVVSPVDALLVIDHLNARSWCLSPSRDSGHSTTFPG